MNELYDNRTCCFVAVPSVVGSNIKVCCCYRMYTSWNVHIRYAQVVLQLPAQLISLLLHVLAANHSYLQGATNVKDMYMCCTGCHLEIVKCLYILLLFIYIYIYTHTHTQYY
jgi:hypothetical protein